MNDKKIILDTDWGFGKEFKNEAEYIKAFERHLLEKEKADPGYGDRFAPEL